MRRFVNIGLEPEFYRLVEAAANQDGMRPATWARVQLIRSARAALNIKVKPPDLKRGLVRPANATDQHWFNPVRGIWTIVGDEYHFDAAKGEWVLGVAPDAQIVETIAADGTPIERRVRVGRPEAAGAALMRSLQEHAAAAQYPDHEPIDDPYAAMDEAARNDPDL